MDMPRLTDPRYYQIAVLGLLLIIGAGFLHIRLDWLQVAVIASIAQLTQYAGSRWLANCRFDPRSAAITTLSLTLLLRTDDIRFAALAALIAIGSKFVLRIRGKHIFNPANGAIVFLMLASDHVWVSTGQWGSATIGAFGLACLGFLVLTRARRAETTLAFLVIFGGCLFGRALWLGDPLSIPLHQLQNGALLIFAFFMISDPMTTPNKAAGRLLYGSTIAVAAYVIQYHWYQPYGALLALFFGAPLVPVIDYLIKGEGYRWRQPARSAYANKGAFPCDS